MTDTTTVEAAMTVEIVARDMPPDIGGRCEIIAATILRAIDRVAEETQTPGCAVCQELIDQVVDLMISCGHGHCAASLIDTQAVKLAKLGRRNGIPLND